MALRHRDLVPAAIDRENIHVHHLPAKGMLIKPQALSRRPALNDIRSNPEGPSKNTTLLPTATVKPRPALKKALSIAVPGASEARNFSKHQLVQATIIDPDLSSRNDPQQVSEYILDIYQYMLDLEEQQSIRENHLKNHKSSPRMRTTLVNWLVQLQINFKLCLDTLFLGVTIVDRYLQENTAIDRTSLQLVGAAAVMVAAKYEEIYIPETDDFVYVCDDTYNKQQIFQMEMDILKRLDFSLGRPSAIQFLRRFSKIANVKPEVHALGKYLLELALPEYEMAHVKPSILAAAACCLSMCIMQESLFPTKIWDATLVHYTTYKIPDFEHTMHRLAIIVLAAPSSKFQAVRQKYSSSSCGKIATDHRLQGRVVKRFADKKPSPTTVRKK